MTAGLDVHVRRVGFRNGTDAELTALHAVEAPIEEERRPHHAAQPVESYLAFARSLPSQFDDHTWLAEGADGTAVASAACWSNAAGDPKVMNCDVFVRRDHRRRGIGTRMLGLICDSTLDEGRSLLTWSTFDTVPAGEQLSRRIGARVARVNRESELCLADVDWDLVASWRRAERARERGYRLELIRGPIPPHLRDDAATFHHIMQTAPRDDLDAADVMVTPEFVAERDRSLVEAGRERWTLFVRDADGRCVGGTETTHEPWEPARVQQDNTGIDLAHRGLGLAKWAKAEMLDLIRRERPAAERIQTGNAFSNGPMLAINDALGFRVISVRTEWQCDAGELRRALAR